jgi:hypothetical protein
MRRTLLTCAAVVALAALVLPGCEPADVEDEILTGIEVDPPDKVDFGTIYECNEHHEELLVINHGPDDEDISVDVDALFYEGYAVTNYLPDMTLEAGDDYGLAIGVSPGPGGAGMREAYLYIVTTDRWIEILIAAEVVAGDDCE